MQPNSQFFNKKRSYYGYYAKSLTDSQKEEAPKKIVMTKQSKEIEKEAKHYETIYKQTRKVRKRIFKLNARGKIKTVFN